METQRAYHEYSGGDAVEAQIVELRPSKKGRALILDKTIFYPEGGGQPADRGSINGEALLDVREEKGEILHLVAEDTALAPGPALLCLDVRRRRDFSTAHTAQHLLSGTLFCMTGFPTLSMHLGNEFCTIDVDVPELAAETLAALEDSVMDAIEENYPVKVHLCPPEKLEDFPLRKRPPQGEEVIRVIEIGTRDIVPCCGTHLPSTGGIGILRILGTEKYKGMTRLSFIAGRRVLADSRMLRKNAEAASRVLNVPVAETGRGTAALLERNIELERELEASKEGAARSQAQALLREAGLRPKGAAASAVTVLPGGGPLPPEGLCAARLDAEIGEALRIGRAAQALSGAIWVLGSGRDLKFAALCAVPGIELAPLLKPLMEARRGRGGGKGGFFQGAFSSGEDMAAFWDALLSGGAGVS